VIRVLRLTSASKMLTAEVFEQLFQRHLGAAFDVTYAPVKAFHAQVLGPALEPFTLVAAADRFREATVGSDFLCPSWEAIPFSPLLLALRNRSGARVRLLLISHAAGVYIWEWTMLRPLLRPGDVIVTPSESARATVEFLAPELAPFLRVISHPMSPLPPGEAPSRPRLVSLGRIMARKLIHRQIEAMAVLRSRGHHALPLEIAGPLDEDQSWPGVNPYCRGLKEKIKRLGLQDQVRLVGPIRGDAVKGAFLSSASLLLNLSMTPEESFPKTPVEALGVGVPVLGTSWNGVRDTVGPCGELLPLSPVGADGAILDLSAESVADGIERLLDARPAPAECMAWVEQFRPEVSVPRYRAALESALEASNAVRVGPEDLPGTDVAAAPAEGLLARAAPLTHYSWRELFDHFVPGMQRTRWIREGNRPPPPTVWDQLSPLLFASTQVSLERFFAGLPTRPGVSGTSPRGAPELANDLIERLWAMATSSGLPEGRLACLAELSRAGRKDLLCPGLDRMELDGQGGAGVDSLRAEAHAAAGDFEAAFRLCASALERSPAVEFEAQRVRQIAAIARGWGRPKLALPWLVGWLDRFPDAQDSGPAWLDLSMTSLRAGAEHFGQATQALDRARSLLGEVEVVLKAERIVAASRARSEGRESTGTPAG
jgi:glycosyltransferase involved in cell wall biosynthesis